MTTDRDRLVVQLEARVRDFEKNFARATRTADRDFGKVENRAKKATDRIEFWLALRARELAARSGGRRPAA